MVKYLTQPEGLQYLHKIMSAVIRHSSLQRYRGDERGQPAAFSLPSKSFVLSLFLLTFSCVSLSVSIQLRNSRDPPLSLSLCLCLFFSPRLLNTVVHRILSKAGVTTLLFCGKAKSSLHISCLSCVKLAAGCPYLRRPGFLWDGEEREEGTERRRVKVYVKSFAPIICPLSPGQN